MAKRPALWSPEALGDIDGIWDYYAAVGGAGTASRMLRDIGRVVALLEDHPLAGRTRDEVRPELRSIAVAPHVVFYRVADGRPEVIRVLADAGTLRRLLGPNRRPQPNVRLDPPATLISNRDKTA